MISVIIPTYNRESVIERAIKSVLSQTYRDIELIIVDDNSKDNTQNVVENIKDDRIVYVKLKENRGACFARNYGIELAKGEYIAFQDSDDEWRQDKLEKQFKHLINNNLDVVSCKIKRINENRTSIFPSTIKVTLNAIYVKNIISTQTILGKKECFKKVKFDVSLPRYQDWDLVINLAKYYKIEIVDEPLVDVYFQDNSITRNPKKAIIALEIFLEKHGVNNKIKARYYSLMGLYKLEDGQNSSKDFKKAFLKNPFNLRISFDYILSSLGINHYHYRFYEKRGRFK